MLEVGPLALAVLVGLVAAAAIMGLASLRAPGPWRRQARWAWAVGGGILAAAGASDQWPHWPALEDRGRFLTWLVPLTMVVETVAATLTPGKTVAALRFGLAAVVAPILLHHTVYLAVLDGRRSADWSFVESAIILTAIGAGLAIVWGLLSKLESRTSTQAVLWVLWLDSLAATMTVMLSGYYGGGLLGLAVSGAIVGATLASYRDRSQPRIAASLGMSVISIFSVVILGRFFGSLSTGLATCLLLAPLLAWIVEFPRLRNLSPAWRTAGRLACVATPLTVILAIAQQRFTEASTARHKAPEASGTSDPVARPSQVMPAP